MLRRFLLLMLLGALVAPISGKASGVIDFGLAGGGAVTWSGGTAPLVGTDIAINTVCGIDTPLNDGVCFNVTDGFLSFTTGSYSGSDASNWYFNGGGTITVDGTIAGLGIFDATLMSGSWTQANVFALGDGVGIVGGNYNDTKNVALAAYFGLGSTGWQGTLNPSIAYIGAPGSPINAMAMAGDVVNSSPIPEPASMALLGSGLLSLGAMIRRKRAS